MPQYLVFQLRFKPDTFQTHIYKSCWYTSLLHFSSLSFRYYLQYFVLEQPQTICFQKSTRLGNSQLFYYIHLVTWIKKMKKTLVSTSRNHHVH